MWTGALKSLTPHPHTAAFIKKKEDCVDSPWESLPLRGADWEQRGWGEVKGQEKGWGELWLECKMKFFFKRLGLYIDQDQMHGTLDSIHSKRGMLELWKGHLSPRICLSMR